MNSYAYAGGNPVNRIDPDGLLPRLPSGAFPQPIAAIDRLQDRARDMRRHNFIDGDKFYHCLAICEAASMGSIEIGIAASLKLSGSAEAGMATASQAMSTTATKRSTG